MKLGIFYEHQLPRPWARRSGYELLQSSLVEVELADRLGCGDAREVEHHFLEQGPHAWVPRRTPATARP